MAGTLEKDYKDNLAENRQFVLDIYPMAAHYYDDKNEIHTIQTDTKVLSMSLISEMVAWGIAATLIKRSVMDSFEE